MTNSYSGILRIPKCVSTCHWTLEQDEDTQSELWVSRWYGW